MVLKPGTRMVFVNNQKKSMVFRVGKFFSILFYGLPKNNKKITKN